MRMKLDRIDMRIVECLQRDGRISNQDLAARVSLSPSACLRRVKLLEEAGIIQGYGCVLDYAKLGHQASGPAARRAGPGVPRSRLSTTPNATISTFMPGTTRAATAALERLG